MEERVDTLVPYGYADVQISTFHAFGDHLIRENALELGLTPEFRVLTRAEQVIFLRAHLFELPLGHYRPLGDPTRHLQAIISHISRLKDEDVGPEEYLAHAEALLAAAADDETRLEAEEQLDLARTYAQYQALMVRLGQVDFGDQIVEALRLFRSRPHVLRRYQERFKHILVDEFQDTNFAQNQLVQLLAAKHGNLTVVADDDQSIYKWRGAALSNVMAFKEQYAGARDIVLTENYRCPQAVLDSAYRLIQYNNPDRLEVKYGISKRLTRVGADDAADRTPEHLAFDTVSSESDRVAAMIAEDCAQGRAYGDFAILVRANNDADAFLRALNMRGIPWTFSGNAGLYGRPEVRLLIAFLRTVAHPDDSVSLHYLASSDIYQVPIVDLTKCATYADRKHRWLFDVLRAVPDEIGAERGGRGGGAPRRRRSRALHGAGPREPHRRAPVPVPARLRPHDPVREGPGRARAGGAERQQVLQSRQGRLPRAPLRQRARVRQPPRRAHRGGRRSRGGRGGRRHARRARAHRAQGQGARVAGGVPRQLPAEPVPLPAAARAARDPRRPHQGHAALGGLSSAGGAAPVLRGDDARQGAALPHERREHGDQARLEGEPVRARGPRPPADGRPPLPRAADRGARAPRAPAGRRAAASRRRSCRAPRSS